MKKVVGYPDRWSVAPGDSLQVMVSTYGVDAYRASLVRVICGDDDPKGPGFKEQALSAPFAGSHRGRTQPIHIGSYAIVPNAAPVLAGLSSFTVQAMIWPTLPEKGLQGIVAWRSGETRGGWALALDETGSLSLWLGGGGKSTTIGTGKPLLARNWYFVGASFDAARREVRLYQEPQREWPGIDTRAMVERRIEFAAAGNHDAPLLIAALPGPDASGGTLAGNHYNGKIDSLRLSSCALDRSEMADLVRLPVAPRLEASVVAAWDFSEDVASDRIVDRSVNRRHGKLVNLPGRGVTGFNWTGDRMCWRDAPEQYGAIHFHDDDLYDAGWNPDFSFTVPATMKSGVYAVKLEAEDDEHYIVFFVRPPRGQATQKAAFLASTATYLAYANYQWMLREPLAEIKNAGILVLEKGDVFLQEHPELGLSAYDTHADGSGVRYSSRLRPVLNMGVKGPLWSFNADTHVLDWLDAVGQGYDVITDEDLHAEGVELLASYRVILTGTHPEYWSSPMWAGMKAYLRRGGRLMYLGGNGFYWRCAFHPDKPGVVEVRRSEIGLRYWAEAPGEYYFSFTGEYAGLWRNAGEPPQTLVGVGTVATGFDFSSYYRRRPDGFDPRVAFVFEGIDRDERIGDFGLLGGGASGLELDAADPALGTPPNALILATSEEHSANMLLAPEHTNFHHPVMDGAQNPAVRADIVFFDWPNGGAVFSVGSIAWAGSLSHEGYDNNVSRITGNVLRRFLCDEPFR